MKAPSIRLVVIRVQGIMDHEPHFIRFKISGDESEPDWKGGEEEEQEDNVDEGTGSRDGKSETRHGRGTVIGEERIS